MPRPGDPPVVEVVEQLVEVEPLLEAGGLGNDLEVGRVEGSVKAPKQLGNGQVKFRVAIEGCWVVDDCGNRESGTVGTKETSKIR